MQGQRILIVDDNYIVASALALTLEDLGAEIAGPATSVNEALAVIEAEADRLDGASIEVLFGASPVYRVADALIARRIPLIFTTVCDAKQLPPPYSSVPRCDKPYHVGALLRAFKAAGVAGPGHDTRRERP